MLYKTHQDIVDFWKENAQDHDDENFNFLRGLKWRTSSNKVDRVVHELHEEVFKIVDCTRCANCCRTLRPGFTDEDIDRIASHLGQTREEFIAAYLELDEESNRYGTKTEPCPLLSADGLCTVYEVRPETCRTYPHTAKKDFVSNTISRANSALACPAAFAIVEEMKERLP